MGSLKKYYFAKSKIFYKDVKIIACVFGSTPTTSFYQYSYDFASFLSGKSIQASSISFSDNLKYIVVGSTLGLLLSDNGGKTFVAKIFTTAQCCSMNASGQYIIAAGANSWVKHSSDFGATWVNKIASKNWRGSAISASGQYQIVCGYSGTYLALSTDYGATWTDLTTATGQSWYSVAISDNGQYILAKPYGGTARVSNNGGSTWSNKTAYGSGAQSGCAMSSNGQYQTFASTGSNIYVSSDYGATFTKELVVGVKNFTSVAMSGDGRFQSAVVDGEYIYVSSDYGVTWLQRGITGPYQSVFVKRN